MNTNKNSFASHPKAKFWSTKNEGLPEDYALNSHKKCWFDCECGHTFECSLLNINKGNNWCGYCSNPPKLLCLNICYLCENKSFASHPKSKCWSIENEIEPRQVFKNADRKKYKFICNICFHNFEINLKCITMKNQFCPYCAHQKLCENNECNMCHNNSFASIERSKFLNHKTINPRMLFKSTNKKYKFDCDKCDNSFDSPLSSVSNGIWCPNCVNKTEEKLYNELTKHYITQRQFKPIWCKNPKTNKYLPFDFVLEKLNIIIEQDGPQHFKQIGDWQSPELTQINDRYKMKCANQNGYSIIRILQKDIWYDKYHWLQALLDNIDKIILDNRVQNIYMCKNDEYKDFDISIL
jgi:very-short-patch-repair endonuclease